MGRGSHLLFLRWNWFELKIATVIFPESEGGKRCFSLFLRWNWFELKITTVIFPESEGGKRIPLAIFAVELV